MNASVLSKPGILLSLLSSLAFGQVRVTAAVLSKAVNQYNGNHTVTDPARLPLAGSPPSLDGVHGYFEYNVTIDTAGWYELLVNWDTALGDYQNGTTGIFYPYTKYYIHNPGVNMTYLNASTPTSSASGLPAGVIKPGNVWLDVNANGSPRGYGVRLENYFWSMAFPPITSFELRPIAANFATNLRVSSGGDASHIGSRYVGVNENLPIVIQAGGNNLAGTLVVEVWLNGATSAAKSYSVPFTAAAKPVSTTLNITVAAAGSYSLKYKVGSSYVSANVNLPKLPFTAIDVTPAAAPANTTINKGTALATIDCAITAPTYTGGLNDTTITPAFNNRVVTTMAGTYRESANTGFADCDHHQPAAGQFIDWANYFAYTLPVTLTKGQMYLVEADYPDDADRSFLMEIRQGGLTPYQIRASGVDTGGYYPPTNSMKTHQIFFWADSSTDSPRVVILNYQNGMRAAASKIRLYKVTGELPWLLGSGTGAGRSFGHWFEEPFCFSTTYNDGSVRGDYATAIERWAKMLKYVGGDTMWVTASVYGDILFPSNNYQKTNLAPNSSDLFKMILLVARKYGLKVVAEFHPKASDELLKKFVNTATPYPHLAVKKDGTVSPSMFNPIYPDNQAWLTGMLKEFVVRYRNEPSFAGISVRSMGWQNTGLNNFQSMDWGYDAYTASQFALNGGPAYDPALTPAQRYALFAGPSYAAAWDAFRVAQINLLYTNLRNTLIGDVNVRPNAGFAIHSPVMISGLPTNVVATPSIRPDAVSAGIRDNNIPGFKYAYSTGYGRRRSNPSDWASDRLELTDRFELGEFASSRSYFATASYAEDGRWTVPNSWLGLAAWPNGGQPWVSGHLVPAGRYNLERYALMMANGDATSIMNGGNNYFVDQDTTREFLKEYNQIPTDVFNLAPGSTLDGDGFPNGNVVVRHLLSGSNTTKFYAVNRTHATRTVNVTFSSSGLTILRPSTGQSYLLPAKTFTASLLPFQMIAYNVFSGSGTITNVSGGTDSFVSAAATSTSTAMNNFTGWMGMKITVGASPITVKELGRWVVAGNTGTHTVKLVDAATGADVPGGSVQVNTSLATAGGFAYGTSPAPVTLAANSTYYLASYETSGGDRWLSLPTVSHTGAATVPGAVSYANGSWLNTGNSADRSYGPVSFSY